ncbi:sensor histidine kinase [Amycolatopsis anabasis]|uniref:sensor histidine kinase n=1 Tax=Amycolatopsis anabasis TaxID=1840409 RepID=UPI003CCD9D48
MPTTQIVGANDAPTRQISAGPGGSRRGLRNWRLRSKLAVVLLIPTLTALVLAGLRGWDELQQANRFQQTADQVAVASKVTAVIHELQIERTLVVSRVAATLVNEDPRSVTNRKAAVDAQISRVDGAISDLRDAAGQLNTQDQAAKERYDRGLQRLNALGPLRNATNTSSYSDLSAFYTYSSILEALVQLGREVNTAVNDQDLLRQGTTTQALSEAKEFTAKEDAALQIAALRNTFPGDMLEQARAAQASGDAAIKTFSANASPDQQQVYSDTVSGPEVDDRQRIRSAAFVRGDAKQSPGIDSARLTTDSSANLGKLRTVENDLLDTLRKHADELASSATTAAWRDAGIVLVALAAAFALMLVIARLMLRPLRVLRSSALDVAYTRLPETVQRILDDPDPVQASKNAVDPVPVHTHEEIGEVARSFDAVHEQAVRMAAEQALLRENVNGIFVNLSRRSQRLVERQLGVIDRLEADEQDPDHLASLFELDHLATRLRRNGESLLVLSGAGLAKSVPKPVPAADVIGAAVSEIEQYARVEVGVIPDVAVRGLTVHDLVHVLAELLDNATYFSEPETKVSVRAVVTRKKALAIQITDRGVGMSDEQITEANKRLADPPDLDVSVTRRMGLYVVARLAQRHGIEVRLRENEDIEGGVIARIVVPADLLGPLSPDGPPPPASRAETSSPSLPPVSVAEPAPPPMPPSPREPAEEQAGGLRPLDQPISLDDLVGGTPNAAFLSPGQPGAEPARTSFNGNGDTPGSAAETTEFSLALPKREPKYVPPEPEPKPPEPEPGQVSALDDDVPTKRLPIYQSVLSRWFSEEEASEHELAEETPAAEPVAYESQQQDPEATQVHEAAEPEPAVSDDWHSVSDEGWQAAQSLLETKSEEITPAGLPKRVPNAYLVPGSVNTGETDSFRDTTVGQPGQGAIARSATAARSRMASFQRGYTTGRHALRDNTTERPEENGVSVSGGERYSSSDTAARSDE